MRVRVLVTGGCGFIGSHLVARLAADGHEVLVFDDLSTGRFDRIEGLRVLLKRASVEDYPTLREAMSRVNVVFHLAAMVSVPLSLEQPGLCLHTNVLGTAEVVRAAVDAGVRTLVFASSAAVYGGSTTEEQSEVCPLHPTTPYGVSKAAGEMLVTCGSGQGVGSLRVVNLRLFNVYGPGQDPLSSYAVVPTFIAQALARQPIRIYGDGLQTRDFVFVEDGVEALLFMAEAEGGSGTFNVGTGCGISVRDLARLILIEAGSTGEILGLPERPGDVRRSVASVDRLARAGFRARMDLIQGLQRTVTWSRGCGP